MSAINSLCDGCGSSKHQSDRDASNTEALSRRESKRQKWQAKQHQKIQTELKVKQRKDWIELNSHYTFEVSTVDVEEMKSRIGKGIKNSAQLDLLLQPYTDLQDIPEQRSSSSAQERLFVAEGTETVRVLLQRLTNESGEDRRESTYPGGHLEVRSIFVKPSVLFDPPVSLLTDIERVVSERRTVKESEKSSPPFSLMIGDESVQSLVAGFPISRGALACGIVPSSYTDEDAMYSYLSRQSTGSSLLRLLALDGISDTANLGSMIRTASACGVCCILLSRDCCDAWYRRSVRVSMGHIFRIPIFRVDSLCETLGILSRAPFSVCSYAAVVRPNADLVLERIAQGAVNTSWCCVVGNEGNGVSEAVVLSCNRTLRIEMDEGVDSLSVPVATGILLHGLKERETR